MFRRLILCLLTLLLSLIFILIFASPICIFEDFENREKFPLYYKTLDYLYLAFIIIVVSIPTFILLEYILLNVGGPLTFTSF